MWFRCQQLAVTNLISCLISAQGVDYWKRREACENSACGKAIMQTFPSLLLLDIQQNWNLPGNELAPIINDAVVGGDHGFINATLDWYVKASKAKQSICWPSDFYFAPGDFETILGALSALITHPDTIGYALPARFEALPPGKLQEKAFCYKLTRAHSAYNIFKNFIAASKKHFKNLAPKEKIEALEKRTRKIAGLVGRTIHAAMHNNYTCSPGDDCDALLKEGEPYKPPSFSIAMEKIDSILDAGDPLCISFTDVAEAPNREAFWINAAPSLQDAASAIQV